MFPARRMSVTATHQSIGIAFVAVALAALLAGVATAQTSAPAAHTGDNNTLVIRAEGAAPQSAPSASAPAPPPAAAMMDVWLRCTGNNVNVRSKPDISSMVLMQVNRDHVLRALGREGEWYRIVPPRGSFSVVAAQYVEMQGDNRGVVNVSDSLKVRVGGPMVTIDPLLREIQTMLEPGAVVEVLGREGDWLRIVPPGGVYNYIHADYVAQISESEAQKLAETVPQPVYEDTPAVVAAPATQPAAAVDSTLPPARQFAELVNRIYAETKKPKSEQRLGPIISALRPLAAQTTDPSVAADAQKWIHELEESAARTPAPPRGAPVTGGDTSTAASRPAAPPAQPSESSGPPKPFDARGVLKPTYALPAGDHGLRYKLEDPVTQKVVAYIEIPIEARVDLRAALNRYVGVRGESYLEPKHEVTIIRVSSLTVLTMGPAAAGGQPRP